MIVKILRTNVRDFGKKWDESIFKSGHPIFEDAGILFKLNSIIEWDFVTWPNKEGEDVEDKDYLGPDKMLEPGDAFSLGGSGNLQIIRIISGDKIGLEHTETGGLALNRIVSDIILPEVKLNFNNYLGSNQVSIEEFDCSNIPSTFDHEYRIPYHLYKIFKDRFFPGRSGYDNGIKATIDTDMSVYPIECYIKDSIVYLNKEDMMGDGFDEELVNDLLSWFYNKYERLCIVQETDQLSEISSILNHIQDQGYQNITSPSSSTPLKNSSNGTIQVDYDYEDFGEFNPDEVYHYSVNKEGDGELYLFLVKKSYWESNGHLDDQDIDPRFIDKYIPDFCSAMEGVLEVPSRFKTEDEVINYLSGIKVFEFNQKFDDFIKNTD